MGTTIPPLPSNEDANTGECSIFVGEERINFNFPQIISRKNAALIPK